MAKERRNDIFRTEQDCLRLVDEAEQEANITIQSVLKASADSKAKSQRIITSMQKQSEKKIALITHRAKKKIESSKKDLERAQQDCQSKSMAALEADRSIIKITRAHARELSSLTSKHKSALSDSTRAHARELSSLTSKHKSALSDSTRAHAHELSSLTSKHKSAISDSTRAHAHELSSLTSKHKSAVSDSQAQLKSLASQHKFALQDTQACHLQCFEKQKQSMTNEMNRLRELLYGQNEMIDGCLDEMKDKRRAARLASNSAKQLKIITSNRNEKI